MKKCAAVALLMTVTGCTSIQVTPLDSSYKVSNVCIEDNPKVIVDGFVEAVTDVFHEHSITTEVYSGAIPAHCEYRMTYTALRSWDFTPYLSHAELTMFKGNEKVAYAEYHLTGKGGFDFSKWDSVRSKMTPVVEELLSQY